MSEIGGVYNPFVVESSDDIVNISTYAFRDLLDKNLRNTYLLVPDWWFYKSREEENPLTIGDNTILVIPCSDTAPIDEGNGIVSQIKFMQWRNNDEPFKSVPFQTHNLWAFRPSGFGLLNLRSFS